MAYSPQNEIFSKVRPSTPGTQSGRACYDVKYLVCNSVYISLKSEVHYSATFRAVVLRCSTMAFLIERHGTTHTF